MHNHIPKHDDELLALYINNCISDEEQLDQPGEPEQIHGAKIVTTKENEQWLKIIELVIMSGKPNCEACQIRVNHNWNFKLLSDLLVDYHDREVLKYLQFGWPIDRDNDAPLEMGGHNHKGTTEYPDHIDKYIAKEIALGAMIGPFDVIPFDKVPVGISPLSSRRKKDSVDWCVIMDCSWVIRNSLNDGLDKNKYMGQSIRLVYPTVDTLARHVHEMAQTSTEPIYFFKEDMDHAFRQLFACPQSVPYLGFRWWNLYYFDLVMMMGCRIAPYICQRTTNLVVYIHNSMGYYLLNYVDDFLGTEHESKITQSHQALLRTMRDTGITRSERKSVPPTQVVEFVGNLFDAGNMTIGITAQRKIDVLRELEKWRNKDTCTRNQMESLVGKLQFMSNVAKMGRLFISRLLAELKNMHRGRYYRISEEARKDMKWWYLFLLGFKGTGIMWMCDSFIVDEEFTTASCLVGTGGTRDWQFFRLTFPGYITEGAKIVHLELWALIIAVKLWGVYMHRKDCQTQYR